MEDIEFNPLKNDRVISVIQCKDGNWKAYKANNGKLIEVRDYDPIIVLQKLLTHPNV